MSVRVCACGRLVVPGQCPQCNDVRPIVEGKGTSSFSDGLGHVFDLAMLLDFRGRPPCAALVRAIAEGRAPSPVHR